MDGYSVIRVGADGKLSIVGEIATPDRTFVYSVDEAVAAWNGTGRGDGFFMVDGWIGGMAADSCDVAGQPCFEVSWLGSTADRRHLPCNSAHITCSAPGRSVAARRSAASSSSRGRAATEVGCRLEVAVP